jgi:hypothetical protein
MTVHELIDFMEGGFVYGRTLLLWNTVTQRWRSVTYEEFTSRYKWFSREHWRKVADTNYSNHIRDLLTQRWMPLMNKSMLGPWGEEKAWLPWHIENPLPCRHVLPPSLSKLPDEHELFHKEGNDFAKCYREVRPGFRSRELPLKTDYFLNQTIRPFMDHSQGAFYGKHEGQNVTAVLCQPYSDAGKYIPWLENFCRLWGFSYAWSPEWDNHCPGKVCMLELFIPSRPRNRTEAQ